MSCKRRSRPLIAVAGPASVDMSFRGAPSDWMAAGAAWGAGGENYLDAPVRLLEQPVNTGLGGNGGAAAYVMGKLGARVQLNAPIGDDPLGRLVRNWLDDADVAIVAPPGASTMFGLTAAGEGGHRHGTLQHPGPPIDWIRSAQPGDATWLLVARYSLATLDDFEQVRRALGAFDGVRALDSGVGWMKLASPPQMDELWAQVDLLIGTVEELAHWTQRDNPNDIAADLLTRGPKQVVIKMGAQSAAWQTHDEPHTHQPTRLIRSPQISIGAGDAFNGALIAHLSGGDTMEQAVRAAQCVAAVVVEVGRGVSGWGEKHSRSGNEDFS